MTSRARLLWYVLRKKKMPWTLFKTWTWSCCASGSGSAEKRLVPMLKMLTRASSCNFRIWICLIFSCLSIADMLCALLLLLSSIHVHVFASFLNYYLAKAMLLIFFFRTCCIPKLFFSHTQTENPDLYIAKLMVMTNDRTKIDAPSHFMLCHDAQRVCLDGLTRQKLMWHSD